MGFIDSKPRVQNGCRISVIFFPMVLNILVFLLSGSTKESAKIQTVSHGTTSHSQDSCVKPEEHQIITMHLANLPEDAKKSEMVLIKPGSFIMGSPMEEAGRSEFAWPLHEVTITKPFYIGRHEVTQAQWEAVMGAKSHRSKFRGPNNPVEKVSWFACQKFIKRLNALGQGTFRLPTEAEWEYACRAGTNTPFSFGDSLEIGDEYMWWRGNSYPNETREVGLKKPNPWGLYDMHGNVSEWCSDLWEKPYERPSQTDPKGPFSNWFSRIWPLSNHVNRGGSIYHGFGARECRSAARHYEQAIDFHYSLGFRLLMECP